MARHYQTFTELHVQHEYYVGFRCGDFVVTPAHDTAALFPKYRLLWGAVSKQRVSSYQLLREYIDEVTPLIQLPTDFLLRFELRLTNPALPNFTEDLPAKASNEVFLFENQDSGPDLTDGSYRKMEVVGVRARLSGVGAEETVTVTEVATGEEFTVIASPNGDVYIDLEPHPVGIYRLEWPTDQTKEVYFDPSLVGKDLFGILHLRQDGLLSIGSSYTHRFAVKSVAWHYYVLLKGNAADHDYEVTPGFSGSGAEDYEYIEDINTGNPAVDATMIAGNILSFQKFTSDDDLEYSEVARTLALKRIVPSQDPKPLIKNLPNPPAGNPNPVVIVTVDAISS